MMNVKVKPERLYYPSQVSVKDPEALKIWEMMEKHFSLSEEGEEDVPLGSFENFIAYKSKVGIEFRSFDNDKEKEGILKVENVENHLKNLANDIKGVYPLEIRPFTEENMNSFLVLGSHSLGGIKKEATFCLAKFQVSDKAPFLRVTVYCEFGVAIFSAFCRKADLRLFS